MPNAVSYIRFSSLPQGQGSTVLRQEEMISDWLIKNPEFTRYEKTFKDLGKSGYHGDHLKGKLGLVTTAIEEGAIQSGDVLLVEAIDRLGRLETMDMMNLIHSIVKAGVKIVTLQDGEVYSLERINTDASCIYILIGKIQQAHDYSKTLSQRISKAWKLKRKKAEQGETVRFLTPFWLTTDGKLIPERAEAVKAAINLYLKGKGHRGILLELAEKYPELKPVHPSTLKRWFKHRALIGEWDHNRAKNSNHLAITKGVFEPLIDEITFYKLQSEAAARTKEMGPEVQYKLAGLVVCDECGSNYHFRRKKTKKDVIVYANCSRYLKRGACSNNKSWPYEVLDQAFNDSFISSLSKISENSLLEDNLKEQRLLETKIAELDKKLESAFDLAIQYPEQKALKLNIDKLNKQREECLEKHAVNELSLSTNTLPNTIENYFELEHKLVDDYQNFLTKHEVPRNINYKIYVSSEKVVVRCIEYGVFEYSIHKRSQKYGCYLVQIKTPEYQLPDEDGNLFTIEANSLKAAINRSEGLIQSISDGTWDDLLHLLQNPPELPEIIYHSYSS